MTMALRHHNPQQGHNLWVVFFVVVRFFNAELKEIIVNKGLPGFGKGL